MRLISWNVRQGGGRRIAAQVAVLAAEQPDIVCLQEVFPHTVPLYADALARLGLPHAAHGFHDGVDAGMYTGKRRSGVLIASRWPLRALAEPPVVPWPERVAAVALTAPVGELALFNVYVPITDPDDSLTRTRTLEGLYDALRRADGRPRIICGDLNTPRRETVDGRLMTFAQAFRPNGDWYIPHARGLGPRRDRAERLLFEDLRAYGIVDCYRHLNGYARQEYSWYRQEHGFRLDHILSSLVLCPAACAYLHHMRRTGLSDHAAMMAEFAFPHDLPGSRAGGVLVQETRQNERERSGRDRH